MASKKEKENNFIYFVMLVFVLFVFIIIAEIIIVDKYLNRDKSYQDSLFSSNMNSNYIDTTNLELVTVELQDKVELSSICEDACNVKIYEYYFLIDKVDNNYYLSIVNDNKIITKKNLGTSIKDLLFSSYEGNLYVFNITELDSFKYDYLIIVNNNNQIDEFVSLESNEMELTEEGIIYYYDSCGKNDDNNAYKIKAIRKPYDIKAKEIDRESKNYPWCSN